MTDDYDQTGFTMPSRGCALCLLAIAVIAIILPLAIRRARQQTRLESERQQAEWRQMWFMRVKQGGPAVSVLDAQLLPMLAEDNDCIRNLKELHFAMVEITPENAAHISRLTNLRSISFYDTRGADHVLEHSRDLRIEELSFDSSPVSQDSLRIVTELPCLKKLHFGHALGPDALTILKALPPGTAVETEEVR